MIGIMDWGIGGLSVYTELRRSGSTADVHYLSDSGNTPYGKLTKPEMRSRFESIAEYFKSKGIVQVLVACNAASSALEADIENFGGVQFQSIIPAGVETANSAEAGQIGVIGGELTISTGIYQDRLGLSVKRYRYLATQTLSALVERGELGGVHVEKTIRDYLDQMGELEALLLACTHYPALSSTITKLYPHLMLLDPAAKMVGSVSEVGESTFDFATTGDPAGAQAVAPLAFGIQISKASKLPLHLVP